MITDSYLDWLARETPTCWWLDSGDPDELQNAIGMGAVGVTTNPVLAFQAMDSKPDVWRQKVGVLSEGLSLEERAEKLAGTVVTCAAEVLRPIYDASGGTQGYVCAQVSPRNANDAEAMLAAARRYHSLAPNISIKVPATTAGLDVLDECVSEGISVTVTVSFTVPQILAVAQRYQRAVEKAKQSGIRAAPCFTVMMIGRLDDYLRDVAKENNLNVTEADITQAGLAVVKRAVDICKQERYDAQLIVAALRGAHHMIGLAGGDLIMSIHPKIQAILLQPGISRELGMDEPVCSKAIETLLTMPDFVKAYEPDGMTPDEFISYGLTQRTLSQFIDAGWSQLESFDFCGSTGS